jgi:hypothetical protein
LLEAVAVVLTIQDLVVTVVEAKVTVAPTQVEVVLVEHSRQVEEEVTLEMEKVGLLAVLFGVATAAPEVVVVDIMEAVAAVLIMVVVLMAPVVVDRVTFPQQESLMGVSQLPKNLVEAQNRMEVSKLKEFQLQNSSVSLQVV